MSKNASRNHRNNSSTRQRPERFSSRRKSKQERGELIIINEKFDEERNLPAIQPKNNFQKEVIEALKTKQVVVIIGSAGVGKSFLTMTHASDSYFKGLTRKIFLSRPAVGMGNTIGLLKGGMREKYEPYLLPVVDVFTERYGKGKYEVALSSGDLEFVPLEYLRGRNLHGIAIVDEAQNCSSDEMYSILTRLTDSGQLIILGDPTQTDIRGENGLDWLDRFIDKHNLHDVATIIRGTSDDIVRGGFCKRVVIAKESESKTKVLSSDKPALLMKSS